MEDKIVIYQLTEGSYSILINKYGNFKLITEVGNVDIPRSILFTFSGKPISLVQIEDKTFIEGYSYEGKFYNTQEFLDLRISLGCLSSLVTDITEWEGTSEEFTNQYKFYISIKPVYKTEIVETEIPFVILYTSTGNKWIKPVASYTAKEDKFYLVTFTITHIIYEVAAKNGFTFENHQGFGSDLKNPMGYYHSNSGSSLHFNGFYAKNTNLDKVRINYSFYPGTMEQCQEEYNRIFKLVEEEFILAKSKITPPDSNSFNLGALYDKVLYTIGKVQNVGYNKKNESDYKSAVKSLDTMKTDIFEFLKSKINE